VFASVGGRLAVVTAAPVGTHTDTMAKRPGPVSAVVQVNLLDAEDLAALARTYLLPELRLADGAAVGPRFEVAGRDGAPIAALTWRTAAPGRDLLARVLPVFGLAALSLTVLAWVVLRHARDAAASIARSEERASHDPLTGLANRRLFDQRLALAFERPRAVAAAMALLYVDLDGFKPVNDTLGHDAGDAVLRETAKRLQAVVRAGDTVARVGGDEFVVLQLGGTQPAGATRLAEAILAALELPVCVDGRDIKIGASIGVALATPEVATPRDLIRRADAALYAAKDAGRGTWRCFGLDAVAPAPAAASPPRDPLPA
jgi:diguanylate cyclase (GGDEF)-like protein